MEKENITPEERLLRLIENPDKIKKKALTGFGKIKGGYFNLKKTGGLLSRLNIDKNFFKQLNLRTINKIVMGLAVVLTLYAIIDFIITNIRLKNHFKEFVAEAAASTLVQSEPPLLDVDVKEVLAGGRRRNIFTFMPVQPEGAGQDASSLDAQAANIISALKLVGIIWSDKPQVMIEDTKEQKTYLLGSGDQISKLKVKKILKDKVILGKDEQEWELR